MLYQRKTLILVHHDSSVVVYRCYLNCGDSSPTDNQFAGSDLDGCAVGSTNAKDGPAFRRRSVTDKKNLRPWFRM